MSVCLFATILKKMSQNIYIFKNNLRLCLFNATWMFHNNNVLGFFINISTFFIAKVVLRASIIQKLFSKKKKGRRRNSSSFFDRFTYFYPLTNHWPLHHVEKEIVQYSKHRGYESIRKEKGWGKHIPSIVIFVIYCSFRQSSLIVVTTHVIVLSMQILVRIWR